MLAFATLFALAIAVGYLVFTLLLGRPEPDAAQPEPDAAQATDA